MITSKQLKIKIESLINILSNNLLNKDYFVKSVLIDNTKSLVSVTLQVTNPTNNLVKILKLEIAKLIKQDLNFKGLKLITEIITNKDNNKFNYLAILSAKGGVGKSTITANLAKQLTKLGLKVGIIDCDIYGASIAYLLKIPHQKHYLDNNQIIPIKSVEGILVVSSYFLQGAEDVLPIRGIILHQILDQFFHHVRWENNPDIILIDTPPGTGDVLLNLIQNIPNLKTILVTTPSMVASKIALKTGLILQKQNKPLLGIIENMSNLQNDKDDSFIFNQDGGQFLASKLDVNLLAKIPLSPTNSQEFKHVLRELSKDVKIIYEME